jgi:hypothetical protein
MPRGEIFYSMERDFSNLYFSDEEVQKRKTDFLNELEVPQHLREKMTIICPDPQDLYQLASLIKAKY